MRSGDLASRVVIDDAHGIAEKAAAYRAMLAREFALDLEFAATLAKRVFLGSFLFNSVPARMVQYHAAQPALPRADAGSVRRHAAVSAN